MWDLVPAEDASAVIYFGIGGLAILMAALIVTGVALVSRRHVLLVGAVIVGAMTLEVVLANSGLLQQWDRLPPPFMLMLIPLFVLTVSLATSSIGEALARRLPFALLIGAQAFRLPLELIMHQASVEGIMPSQLTYTGYNFDIVSGASALVIAVLAAARIAPRWLLMSWNLMGLALLFTVIVLAITSMPIIQAFGSTQVNTWITFAPFVWLPGMLVQSALLGHILVWRKLKYLARQPEPDPVIDRP